MASQPELTKSCGSCTFCCKVMTIDELKSASGVWCPHCEVGSGCGIYESRPQDCRDFLCQWILDPRMPDALRPDKVKVVLAIQEPGPGLVALCDTANPLAWKKEPIYSALKRWATEGWGTPKKALARAGDRLWVITPKEDLDLGEIPPNATYSLAMGPDGKIRATVHPPE